MLGTIVNSLAIISGGLAGLFFRGKIPGKYHKTVIDSIALAVILIGLKSALAGENILLIISSLAIGSLIGELAGIEGLLLAAGRWLEKRLSSKSDDFSKGFVTASLVYCVGSMAIVGALESGLAGNHQTLFAKSILDGIGSVVFASTLGAGVIFSSVSVFLYQGMITLAASSIKGLLNPAVISEMSAVGGLLIVAIGFNLLDFKKIRVGNMLPAIFIPLAWGLTKGI